jgi:hypothetical protein
MAAKKYEKPFHLDMPFNQALERFVQTDQSELSDTKSPRRRKQTKRKATARATRGTPVSD